MINWEELKHIHVIRKLEEILAQWFNTDIFFVDERGQIRNYDPNDKRREFKNPLTGAFLNKERGRLLLIKSIADANETAFKSDQAHLVVHGPAGFENILVSRINADNEFLGSVVAYSYLETEISDEA